MLGIQAEYMPFCFQEVTYFFTRRLVQLTYLGYLSVCGLCIIYGGTNSRGSDNNACLCQVSLIWLSSLLTSFPSYAVIAYGCASCPKLTCEREGCQTEFCYHCKQIWHPNQTCDMARQQRAQTLRVRTKHTSGLSYGQESGPGISWHYFIVSIFSIYIVSPKRKEIVLLYSHVSLKSEIRKYLAHLNRWDYRHISWLGYMFNDGSAMLLLVHDYHDR